MTRAARHFGIPPAIHGTVELIEQRGFVTRPIPAERIAQAYLPVQRPDRLPFPVAAAVIVGLSLLLWGAIAAPVWWVW